MVGGSLDEIGLSHLIQVYCTSRQTAKLTVSYPDAEGSFFFDRGELVDAQLGSQSGIDAVHAALGKKGGVFRVEPGVQPPRRSINQHWSTVVIDGMRVADASAVRARPAPPAEETRQAAAASQTTAPMPATARVTPREPLPLRPAAEAPPRERSTAVPARPRPVPPERAPLTAVSGRESRLPMRIAAGAAVLVVAAGVAWFLTRPGRVQPKPVPVPAPPRNPVITLGMSAALTGPASELGRQMKLGVETCLNAVNDGGGILGHKFQLVALDDGYEPDRTRQTMKELIEDRKVFALVGNVGTPTAEVAVPYILQKKVLLFGAFTGAGLLRRDPPDRYVLNYRASYAEETAGVVKYLIDLRKVKPGQIAVFAQQDGFGDAGFAGVARALRRYGRSQEQILRVGFKRNTLELNDAVDEILKNKKDIRAIVMVAPYRPAALFIEKIKDQGFDPIFTNVSFVGSTALAGELKALGAKYPQGVIVTQVVPPVDSSATEVIRYREALEKYFRGEKPDFVSLEGYLAASVLMEGFRRAGKNPTGETLIDALESIRGLDIGIGAPITYGLSEHQGSHKVWGTVLDENATYHVFDME
ncbi:MAG TPA: ABC transporter substrate-binding protein [Thermoanaerobaculia bacterium]|nr:ABC transporter substrate-binding protein [Thermoanaerobaculia bacterium]